MTQRSIQSKYTTKTLVLFALMIALSIILERFLGINTPFFKLHLGYLPVAATGMLFGVGPGIFVGTLTDILGNLDNLSLPFIPLAAIEAGLFSAFLYPVKAEKKEMVRQAVFAQLSVTLIVHMGLNTLLLYVLFNSFLPMRFVMSLITFPVRVFTLYLLLKYRKPFEAYLG